MRWRALRVAAGVVAFSLMTSMSANAYILMPGVWNPATARYSNSNIYPMSSTWMSVAYGAAGTWTAVFICPFSIVRDEAYGDLWGSTLGAYNRGVDSGRLAVTQYTAVNGTIYRAWTWVNTYYPWSTSGSTTAFDLQSCLTHEFGHWVPLADVTAPTDATMYRTMAKGETIKRSLAADDINGVRAKYP